MKHFLPTLFFLATLSSTAQYDCSFTLVSTQVNSSGTTRSDSIAYSFQGANTAIKMYGSNGQPDVRILFDPELKTITQLHEINGMKGGFVFAMSEKRWPGMAYSTAEVSAEKMKWTGKTSTIDGHECHEAKVTSEEYTGTAWVAKDIPLSLVRVFSYQSVGAGKNTSEVDELRTMGLQGLPLEMTLKSTTGKRDVTLRIVDHQAASDPTLFSTEGHSTTFVEE
ncbi:MAG: DUF4412 domain-containing protein [Flavobacteriales bacterium]|nr:DUF4412 domain-containing protein [Flavobacteriales bacterium]